MLAAAKLPMPRRYPDQNEIFVFRFFDIFLLFLVKNFSYKLNIFNFNCFFDYYYANGMYKRVLHENYQELKKWFYCCSASDQTSS